MKYYLYILRTVKDTLYTGITTDIKRRFKEHICLKQGAKYTKANKPVEIMYLAIFEDRSEASREEYRIKHKLLRKDKLELIEKNKQETQKIIKSI